MTTWHMLFMGIAGAALLANVVGSALGYWRIAPTVSHWGQMLIRFGMALAGVSCTSAAASAWLQGLAGHERVAWEAAAYFGFAVLALGLLVGAVERDFVRRRAARQHLSERHGGD